jgi:hypothetical protein
MDLFSIFFATAMTVLITGLAAVFWTLFDPFAGLCVIGLWVLLCYWLLRPKHAAPQPDLDQLNAFQRALAEQAIKDSEKSPKA